MSAAFELILCDLSDDVIAAWKRYFELKHPEVSIRKEDILATDADAVVIPSNAFGFLDRGLDLHVCEAFGFEIQDALREKVRSEFFGELLIGQACWIPATSSQTAKGTGPRWLIFSCLYRTPGSIEDSLNAYLCARGAFRALESPPEADVRRIAMPGLGTGKTGLNPYVSTRQLRYAYQIASGQRGFGDKNLSQLTRRERKLRSLPKSTLEEDEA